MLQEGGRRDVSLHRGSPRPSLMLVFSAHVVHNSRIGAARWLEVSATPRGWPRSASSDRILPHPDLPESSRDTPTFPPPLGSSPLPWSIFHEGTFKEGKPYLYVISPLCSDGTRQLTILEGELTARLGRTRLSFLLLQLWSYSYLYDHSLPNMTALFLPVLLLDSTDKGIEPERSLQPLGRLVFHQEWGHL